MDLRQLLILDRNLWIDSCTFHARNQANHIKFFPMFQDRAFSSTQDRWSVQTEGHHTSFWLDHHAYELHYLQELRYEDNTFNLDKRWRHRKSGVWEHSLLQTSRSVWMLFEKLCYLAWMIATLHERLHQVHAACVKSLVYYVWLYNQDHFIHLPISQYCKKDYHT